MTDIVDVKTRSRMMSGIRGKNTKPEILVRQRLHARGYRYRLHRKDLPGSPDIVLPRYKAAILVNGCFWHGHRCRLFKWPRTRPDFWQKKIKGNILRDRKKLGELQASEWRVCVLWECEIRTADEVRLEEVIERITEWLIGGEPTLFLPNMNTQRSDG